MNDTNDPDRPLPDPVRLRHAKGAAREAIGKLIGDDAAVREGQAEQQATDGDPAAGAANNKKDQE